MTNEVKSNVRRIIGVIFTDFEDGWQFCEDEDVESFVQHRKIIADVILGKKDFSALSLAQPSTKPIVPDAGIGYKVYFYVSRKLDVHNKFRAGKLAMFTGFSLVNLPQANNMIGNEIISMAGSNLRGKIEPHQFYSQFGASDVTANEALQMFENNKHIFDAFYIVPIKEKAEGGRKLSDRRTKNELPKINFGRR